MKDDTGQSCVTWEDTLNEEKVREGVYLLHRNYITNDRYSNTTFHTNPLNSNDILLTQPVAMGFAAFLYGIHKQEIENSTYTEEGLYTLYYNHREQCAQSRFNEKSLSVPYKDRQNNPDLGVFNQVAFKLEHLGEERIHLQNSTKVFTEVLRNEQPQFIQRMKGVCEGYLYWLEQVGSSPAVDNAASSILDSVQQKRGGKIRPLFESFLIPEGKEILSEIKRVYQNKKPEDLIYLVFALDNLQLTDPKLSKYPNQTAIYEAMKSCFGKIGSRQQIAGQIKAANPKTDKLQTHVNYIQNLLKTCANKKQENSK